MPDVIVIGGGIAGLLAARQLAHLGNAVLVLEERDALGGFVARGTVAGVELDTGAESFATRKGTVATLVTELGLGDDIVAPNPAGAWVQWNGGAAPLPAAGVLGIPGVPLADDVRRVIGWGGSLRAYLDRLMPLLRVRPETDLGDIVRRRMGRTVLERLVTPVVAGVHSADPSVVDVHTVAPGLTQAMTTQGSLSGAVMALREMAPAGSQVQGIAGGMNRLVDALEADCRYYGVEFRTGTRVTALSRRQKPRPAAAASTEGDVSGRTVDASSGWVVRAADAEAADGEVLEARAVVVATGIRPALALLGGAGVEQSALAGEWPAPASVTIATLVIDDAQLDAHPRGTGVLVAPGTPGVEAKALTHSSAKWAWLAESLPAGRHVVRLSYGRRGPDARVATAQTAPGAQTAEPASGAPVPPAPSLATAVRDASALLGIPLSEADVAGFALAEWSDSLAFATVGHKTRARQVLAAVEDVDGLDVVGAWVSGTGLAATVEQTRLTASGLAAELRGAPRLRPE